MLHRLQVVTDSIVSLLHWAWNLTGGRAGDPGDVCGPQGSWKSQYVPDRIWGVSLRSACSSHDMAYNVGRTGFDKTAADRQFFWDIVDLFRQQKTWPWWVLKGLPTAWLYYRAVSLYGDGAFWKGKENDADGI